VAALYCARPTVIVITVPQGRCRIQRPELRLLSSRRPGRQRRTAGFTCLYGAGRCSRAARRMGSRYG
jgi:hypothetical protein